MLIKSTYIAILGLLLMIPNNGNSQVDKEEKVRPGKQSKLNAIEDIRSLRGGTLLVCLHTDKMRIKALEEKGFTETAKKVKHENDSIKEVVIQAFKEHYQFSNFYFFYADDISEIKKGNTSSVFFDQNGETVEYSGDTTNTFILETRYINMENMGNSQLGLAILDYNFVQLENPFPYYVRKRESLSFLRRDYEEMISLLNGQLTEYFEDNY